MSLTNIWNKPAPATVAAVFRIGIKSIGEHDCGEKMAKFLSGLIQKNRVSKNHKISPRDQLQNQFSALFVAQSAMLVLLAGSAWQMLTPQPLSASATALELSVQAQPSETYEALVERAVQVAKTALEKAFAAQQQQDTIVISVSGQNQGAIAPILKLQVSRSQWQTQPEIRRWASFYPSSKMLLGFGSPVVPTSAPVSVPVSPQQPSVSGPVPMSPKQPSVSGPVPVQPVPVDLLPGRPVAPQVIPGLPISGEPVRLEQLPDNLLPGMSPQLPTQGTETVPVSTQPRTVEPTIVQPAMVQPTSVQPTSVQPGLILPSP